MKNVVIIGAGGHAKVIADIVIKSNDNLVGFLDDNEILKGKNIFLDYKVLGTLDDINKYNNCYFIIGIGNNKLRKRISQIYSHLNWYTAIHPSAIISDDVKINCGTAIMPGVVINPGSVVGKHVIINTSSSIDHDNRIGDFVHVSPGAHLAGNVTIDEGTWICAGVTVINNIMIGKNNIVGAGAVVIDSIIDENSTFVGVPIKKVK